MSEHDLPPLDADVLALLDEAKPIPPLEDHAKDALFAAIATRLPPLPGGGGDGGGSPDGGGSGGAGLGSGAATGTIATTATRAAITLVATFGVGIAVGVGIDRAATPAPPPVIASPVSVMTPAPSAAPSTSVDLEGVPVNTLPSVRVTTVARMDAGVAPVVSAKGLGAERALLDVARGSLARGEANEALAATERHGREYPDGALVEEREAIAIKALVALGRREEAQKRAVSFERKFPNGLMLRAVKSAVEPSP